MSTPFDTDEILSRFSDLTEVLALKLIQILSKNYKEGKLSLGNNAENILSKREVFYTVADSDYENTLLYLKYKNNEVGYPHEILLESRGIDLPSELKIQIDDFLVERLPQKMISDLKDHFYDIQ